MIPTLLLLACKGPGPDKPELWPFPSAHLVSDGHVAIPAEALPRTEGGTPFDVDRLAFRTGFSVVQTTVIDPGTGLDPDTLPGRDDAATPGSVQIGTSTPESASSASRSSTPTRISPARIRCSSCVRSSP